MWPHRRDLMNDPLQPNECICSRQDCASGMYQTYLDERRQGGSTAMMQRCQKYHNGQYPLLDIQVKHMLAHVDLRGGYVLDCCGSKTDAVYRVLTDEGLHVLTNDINERLTADTHLDVLNSEFLRAYGEGARQPQWIVANPPYKHAFAMLRQALAVARVGVIFKLRLSFLEPTKSRGGWLRKNSSGLLIALSRAKYQGWECNVPEAWIMWYSGKTPRSPLPPQIVFAV